MIPTPAILARRITRRRTLPAVVYDAMWVPGDEDAVLARLAHLTARLNDPQAAARILFGGPR